MSPKPLIAIDTNACTGCGLCVETCPSETLGLRNGRAKVVGERCLVCDHCAAICPVDAVRVEALDAHASSFATFETGRQWLEWGGFPVGELVRLMRSRRSCRSYKQENVPLEILEDLVRIGVTAPSGTNSQKWTFTLVPTRREVMALGDRIGDFFRRLNRLAERKLLRKGLSLMGKPTLENYYHRHYRSVARAIREWEEEGRDILFHGATAVIVVGSEPGGSCPAEDALLATQNILLGAHCLGLGTCLIGYAVEAMRRDRSINASLGIPAEESVHAVIALGYPGETYQRVTGRKAFTIRTATVT